MARIDVINLETLVGVVEGEPRSLLGYAVYDGRQLWGTFLELDGAIAKAVEMKLGDYENLQALVEFPRAAADGASGCRAAQ